MSSNSVSDAGKLSRSTTAIRDRLRWSMTQLSLFFFIERMDTEDVIPGKLMEKIDFRSQMTDLSNETLHTAQDYPRLIAKASTEIKPDSWAHLQKWNLDTRRDTIISHRDDLTNKSVCTGRLIDFSARLTKHVISEYVSNI